MPDVNNTTDAAQASGSQWSMNRSVSGAGNASLTIEDFYKLLAAQLKYQDADNPMDTSEMMAQMVQTQMIETINQMNQMSVISYAAGMIGKEVTVGLIDEETKRATGEFKTGVVTGISLFDGTPMLYMDGGRYSLSQVAIVGNTGTVPPEDGEKDPSEEGKEPGTEVPGTGEVTGTPGTEGGTETPGTGEGTGTPGTEGGTETPGTGGGTETPGTGGGTETPGTGGGTETPGTGDGTGTPGTGEGTETSGTESGTEIPGTGEGTEATGDTN